MKEGLPYKVPFRLVTFSEVIVRANSPEEAKEKLKGYSAHKLAELTERGYITQWVEVENPYIIRDKNSLV